MLTPSNIDPDHPGYLRYHQWLDRYHMFRQKHPDVMTYFNRFAFDRLARKFTHYSADAVMHRVRWETGAGARPGEEHEEFKINDCFVAYYSRDWMRAWPTHGPIGDVEGGNFEQGFFRTRTQKTLTKRAHPMSEDEKYRIRYLHEHWKPYPPPDPP